MCASQYRPITIGESGTTFRETVIVTEKMDLSSLHFSLRGMTVGALNPK